MRGRVVRHDVARVLSARPSLRSAGVVPRVLSLVSVSESVLRGCAYSYQTRISS
jgi:hypothetical protein